MKSILLKILSVISPLVILAILGIMQGAWFDIEEFVERGDAELYHPATVQYVSYYLVSVILLVLSWLLLQYEYKKASDTFFRKVYTALFVLNVGIILICALSL